MQKSLVLSAAALVLALGAAQAQDTTMSFFITSVGLGKGANLGGLDGADAHCASLAEAAGVTGKTWRAYLSTASVDAKDRIGAGPWFNAKGEKIADDVASLHSDANAISKQTGLDEKGNDGAMAAATRPTRHDILTGSMPTAPRSPTRPAATGRWTAPKARRWSAITTAWASTIPPPAKSWNSSHPSRGGCSQEALHRHRRRRLLLLLRGELSRHADTRSAQSLATGRSASTATVSSGLVLRVWNTTQ